MLKRASQLPAVFLAMLLILSLVVGCQQKNVTTSSNPLPNEVVIGENVDNTEPPLSHTDPNEKHHDPIEISSKDVSSSEGNGNDHTPLDDSPTESGTHSGTEPNADSVSDEADNASESEPESTEDELSEPLPPPGSDSNTNATDRYYLLGISTQMSMAEVSARFSKPGQTFSMPDDNGTLTIHDYGQFMVGFNDSNKVVFIDVFADSLDIGLKGIRIGATANEAIRELGSPYSQSDYVLNFIKGNTVLKMDLDPESQRILSIKLFANE